MQVTISSKNLKMTESIEDYARTKCEKFARYFDRTEQVNVKLEKTNHGFDIEIICNVEHHELIISKHEADDIYAAIDICIDKSVRQLTDLKSKIKDNKHNRPIGGKER